jgi:hypothetical protein
VVKLKYNRIGLAAIHARVQREILPKPPLVFGKRHSGCRLNASEVTLTISQVPEPLVFGEACAAPRLTDASSGCLKPNSPIGLSMPQRAHVLVFDEA